MTQEGFPFLGSRNFYQLDPGFFCGLFLFVDGFCSCLSCLGFVVGFWLGYAGFFCCCFFVSILNPNFERKSIMTDSNTNTSTHSPAPTPVNVASRQQGAAAPDSGGRSVAPCDSVHFETAATAITSPPARILRLPEVM